MNILSFRHVAFLAAVFMLHWALSPRFRWIAALLASAVFVACCGWMTLVMVTGMIILSYVAGIVLQRRGNEDLAATALFRLSIIAPLAVLCVFKYGNFVQSFFVSPSAGVPFDLRRFLPIGISFWTFSMLSYLFDVRRKTIPAEGHLGRYAVYVLFFPKFISGPIDRAANLLPQVREPPRFDYDRAVRGMRQIAIGLLRKIVVADVLAVYTDRFFSMPSDFPGIGLLVGAVGYSLQIYNDFAGYSDIAIGSARVLGYDLKENFHASVFATSLKDFWARWHISLSTWFRDYLYFPLGGSRCGKWRTRLNLLATFTVSGLWHGAHLTFLVWGAIHGLFQILEKAAMPARREKVGPSSASQGKCRASQFLRWCATFTVVTVAWVFFRSDNLASAWVYLQRMSQFWISPIYGLAQTAERFRFTWGMALQLAMPIAVLGVWDWMSLSRDPFEAFGNLPAFWRWLAYGLVMAAILFVVLPQGESANNFIYYQF